MSTETNPNGGYTVKKLIAALLAVILLFSLFGCTNFYEPVESTEREKSVVMTFTLDGAKYDLTYEVYRAFFLTYKDEISGGDDSVWTGANAAEYIEKINEKIVDMALDIYSTFALARRVGIDPYSTEIGKTINSYINESIKAAESYSAYLASLKKLYLNYSMQTLLFRYAVVLDKLELYYIGASSVEELESGLTEPGAITYTDDDIAEFYNSDDCKRILRVHIQGAAHVDPMAKAEKVANDIRAAKSESEIVRIMVNNSLIGGPEIENGYMIGKYNLDTAVYGEMVDAVFEADSGDVVGPIVIHDGDEYIYYVIYIADKSAEHLEENMADVTYVYLWNAVGELLEGVEDALEDTVTMSDFYKTIIHSEISMDEEAA